ncbi:hypothetical protein [Streptomyces sp. NPDC051211]|uniref:hypothetical protein n=1 Tax=Streptomyces sp. NPDC051211 TaxID=3154643 RepID=UPI0034506ECB
MSPMTKLGVFAGAAAALATVVAMPAQAQAQAIVLCSQTALRNAITQANTIPGPAVLFLAPGCTYTLTSAHNPGNGLPIVTSPITVIGSGNTIQRQSAAEFRIFEANGANAHLTLNNVTVRGGRSDSNGGGGILAGGGADLTLNSVEVTRNVSDAEGRGAGVNSGFGSQLTVRNSTVSFNFSTNNAGGINSDGTANISNTTITGNTAQDSGGGMDARNSMTLSNSRVTDNAAGDDGGGIHTLDLTATIRDTLIRGNTSTGSNGNGGGIQNRDSTLTLERTTVFANRSFGINAPGGGIANNAASTLTLRNSSVTHNSAREAPGGIYNDGGTVSLTATPVTDNEPTNCTPSAPPVAGCVG